MDGLTVVRKSRQGGCNAPIIMMTQLGAEDRGIEEALHSGVDECLVHPISVHDLNASIRSLEHGRKKASPNPTVTYDGITLNINNRELHYQGTSLRLTKRQSKIMELLLSNVGVVLTKDIIFKHGWDNAIDIGETNFDSYIRSIRNALLEMKSTLELRSVDNERYCLQERKPTNKFARK